MHLKPVSFNHYNLSKPYADIIVQRIQGVFDSKEDLPFMAQVGRLPN